MGLVTRKQFKWMFQFSMVIFFTIFFHGNVFAEEKMDVTSQEFIEFGGDYLGADFFGEIPEIQKEDEKVTLTYYAFSKPYDEKRKWSAKIMDGDKSYQAESISQCQMIDGTKVTFVLGIMQLSGGEHKVNLYENNTTIAKTTISVQSRYYISYEPNAEDAIGNLLKDVFYYGERKALSKEVYKRSGYQFLGWNTKADGKGKLYEPGQEIENMTAKGGVTISLYATWKVLRYHVQFVAGTDRDGQELIVQQDYTGAMKDFVVNYGVNRSLPPNCFKRKGYTFAGWEDENGNCFKNKQQIANLVTGTEEDLIHDSNGIPLVTLRAKWDPAIYKVTYRFASTKAPGGVMIPKITEKKYTSYDTEKGLSSLPDLSKYTIYGYEFHWYRDAKYQTKIEDSEIPIRGSLAGETVTGNKTFYGKWTKMELDDSAWFGTEYTIQFEPNRPKDCPEAIQMTGLEKMESVVYLYGKKKNLPNNQMKLQGYQFGGWAVSSDATLATYPNRGAVSGFLGTNGMERNVTLYAIWKPVSYKITYKNAVAGKSGVYENDNPATYTVEAGKILLSEPKKTGYDFEGWYYDVKYGNSLETIAKNGKIAYYLNTEKAKTQVVYAKWVPKKVTIAWNPNLPKGTELGKNSDKKMVEKNYVSGKGTSILANSYRVKGYTFLGWSTSPVETSTEADFTFVKDKAKIVDLAEQFSGKTICLYAIWGKTNYQIVYEPYDVSKASQSEIASVTGSMSMQTANIKKKIRLLSNRYRRNGYRFVCWNTKADGSGISYANNAYVQAIGNGKQKITLYAIWEKVEY